MSAWYPQKCKAEMQCRKPGTGCSYRHGKVAELVTSPFPIVLAGRFQTTVTALLPEYGK